MPIKVTQRVPNPEEGNWPDFRGGGSGGGEGPERYQYDHDYYHWTRSISATSSSSSSMSLSRLLTRHQHSLYYVILILVSLTLYGVTLYQNVEFQSSSSSSSLISDIDPSQVQFGRRSQRETQSEYFRPSPQAISFHGLHRSGHHSFPIGSIPPDGGDDLEAEEGDGGHPLPSMTTTITHARHRAAIRRPTNPVVDLTRVRYTISPTRFCSTVENENQSGTGPQEGEEEKPQIHYDHNGNVNEVINDIIKIHTNNNGGKPFSKNDINLDESGETSPLFLLGFIHSAPGNFARRSMIRRTWASIGHYGPRGRWPVRFLFVLGHPANPINSSLPGAISRSTPTSTSAMPPQGAVQREILAESHRHGDILQVTFEDSYQNLTYKHLAAYKWILDHCGGAHFVAKLDDDAFLDPFAAVDFLSETFQGPQWRRRNTIDDDDDRPHGILACSVFPAGTPTRRLGKWSLTREEYPWDTYPSYCSGVAYFVTPDVMGRLLGAVPSVPPVFIDDLYVTGLLAAAAAASTSSREAVTSSGGQPSRQAAIRKYPLNSHYSYSMRQVHKWLQSSESFTPNGIQDRTTLTGDDDDDDNGTASSSPSSSRNALAGGPFLVADIGSDPIHWTSVAEDLWRRSVAYWARRGRSSTDVADSIGY